MWSCSSRSTVSGCVTLGLGVIGSELRLALLENANDENICLFGLLRMLHEAKQKMLRRAAGPQEALGTDQL